VLGTLLVTFGLSELASFIYRPHRPEKPAFSVAVQEAPAPAEATQAGGAPAKPIAELLKTASPEKGQAVAKACAACHDMTNANGNKVGPGLWNVVDRPIASHPGFAYSDALKAKSGEKWTYDHLSGFLHNPKGYVPGTKMTYAGVQRDDQRADLIAYLRTLADNPQPLSASQ
jgi:cytochrome c